MQSVTNCDSTVCTFSQLVWCAFVHLMAQFVLMHPASWGERAHTKNVCQTLAPKCWHICATRLWAFSLAHLFRVAQLCKEPTQKTFQWKAKAVLLHGCEELLRAHHVCCTSVCFFIHFLFMFVSTQFTRRFCREPTLCVARVWTNSMLAMQACYWRTGQCGYQLWKEKKQARKLGDVIGIPENNTHWLTHCQG